MTSHGMRWVVSRREQGKRRRSFFNNKEAAEAEASRLRLQVAARGEVWSSLTASERQQAIEHYLDGKTNASSAPRLHATITEMIDAKTTAGRADDYTASLRIILSQFSKGREAMPIDRISVGDVEQWLKTKAAASRSTLRARLSTLFKYAVRKRYRPDNPCDQLEAITITARPPQVFTVRQVQSCLAFLSAEHKWGKQSRRVSYRFALPWFILSTFCGLRPEEAEKTTRKEIHQKEGWVKVEAQTTKIRQRRVVYPKPEAMALLKACVKNGKLPLHPQARRRVLKRLRAHLGWKRWPKDITRHTAASYWLASCGSVADVATALGNSEKVLRKNYMALVTRAEAEKFWGLDMRIPKA